ncbi:MAG TPA: hypothetical protein PKI66_07380 [Methanobacteriaceae archaeon]|jgi:uncharacterized membrane protein HdeD (DUF308 family)|nr:hypothetical protein [Euryarchaeota archaeon]HNR26518.1 hypothetical protein [Methanobacteriaceae archaeon]
MEKEYIRQIIGIAAIIIGILLFIYPQMVGYLVGVFLLAYGIVELIK